MMEDLPMLVQRCLTHQVQIYPYQMYGVMHRYAINKIPDDVVAKMSKEDLTKYVEGLYLASCEYANDWTKGLSILQEMGFVERKREEGHRTFISLVYAPEEAMASTTKAAA